MTKVLCKVLLLCALAAAVASCGGGSVSSLAGGDGYGVFFKAQSDDRYGMISSDGEILFEDEFEMPPSPAVGGVFSAMGSDFKIRYYTASPKPEAIGKDAYVAGGYCTEGVIPVVKEGQPVVLIDKSGKEVASLAKADGKRVTMVNGYFSDGLMLFSAERKFGYFNPKGGVAIKAVYDVAYPFSDGLAVVAKSKADGSMSWSAIDKSGKEVARLNISYEDMTYIPMYFDGVLVCGPKPMLKSVAAVCAQLGTPCQVSMEERMGCGVGACLVCACKNTQGHYVHVCKDGPVFPAQEVDWNE